MTLLQVLSSPTILHILISPLKLLLSIITLSISLLAFRILYRLSPLHPLSHIPGPYLPRISSLWLTYHAWIGDECTTVHRLHERYGSIVRTGPSSVDIADGAALHDIYVARGGFRKAKFYGNFRIDGHESIFSEIVPENRAPRAKAVVPLFATANLRARSSVLDEIVQGFVRKVQNQADRSRENGKAVNLLDLTRGLAVDAVTGYLFGRPYGGVEDDKKKDHLGDGGNTPVRDSSQMSASGMVDVFVAVGRFWYLPSWAFQWVDWFDAKFGAGSAQEVGESLDLVDEYVAGIVKDAEEALTQGKEEANVNGVTPTLYAGRLLSIGLSISETRAQCKDLIFAGTDSTGMNLATIIFYLAKYPEIYQKLREEVLKTTATDLMEIQSMPYLRGVVREGLRLAMANPSRFPRVVPSTGWTFEKVKFPAGAEVSCTPFELHLNPGVFPEPHVFQPERWIDSSPNAEQMERDAIPFGIGTRQCIARNLATAELFLATKALVQADCLANCQPVGDKIEILEWFNSHVVGGKVEVKWT